MLNASRNIPLTACLLTVALCVAGCSDTKVIDAEIRRTAGTEEVTYSPPQVKDAIDRAVRYLRGTQDSNTGQYGEGVEDTARVLIAFAQSPRAYSIVDGPFIADAVEYLRSQRNDKGLISDALATDQDAKVQQTLLAALALAKIGVPGFGADGAEGAALAAAALAVDEAVFEQISGKLMPTAMPLDASAIGAMLKTQTEDGLFLKGDSSSAVQETAMAMDVLTATWHDLRAAEVKPASEVKPLPTAANADTAKITAAMNRGALYLVNEGSIEPGRWGAMGQADPGISAMVLGALLATPEPRPAEVDAAIDAGLEWLVSMQKEDGAIHAGQLANYVTSASILALAAADRLEFKGVIEDARKFLTVLQADEGEGYAPGHRYYGGVGYGGDERPDLSNLQMAMDALAAAGTKADDPAFNKALAFLERTQNRSESNDVEVAGTGDEGVIKSGNDGGGGYAPGESKAGFVTLADGTRVPRSYGSMTFALLKGYLLAGLEKDDPRVEAAWTWITKNYSLDLNPGFEASEDPSEAYQGLFYYFLAMARALELYGSDEITTPDGELHNWKQDLGARLTAMQKGDGSWENTNSPRWFEGNPTLATAYALLIMESTL